MKAVAALEHRRQVLVRNVPGEDDPFGQPLAGHLLEQRFVEPALLAGQHQLHPGKLRPLADAPECLNDPHKIFTGLERADIEQVALRQVVFRTDRGEAQGIRHLLQRLVAAQVDHVNLVFRRAVGPNQVGFRRL